MEENKKIKWWNKAIIKNDKKLFSWLNLVGIIGLIIVGIMTFIAFTRTGSW